jgi:hypothetical protein
MNTIAIAKRVSGHLALPTPLQFDRIRLDTDINTHVNDTKPRFDPKHIETFFTSAVGWHEHLDRELISFLGLEGTP